MEPLQDLKISGISKMNGGKFDRVSIAGMGKLFGDVEANQIKIEGTGSVEGSVKAGRISVEGSSHIEGSVETKDLSVEGNFKIGGHLTADSLDIEGRCKVLDAVKAQKVRVEGLLSVNGGLEAEEFMVEGAFDVGGLLNANKIDISLSIGCKAGEIGGESIRVRKGQGHGFGVFLLVLGKPNKLQTQLIEGTDISVEYTDAKIIRGNNVRIGPKCCIEQVEYSGTLEVDPDAEVKIQKKV